MSKENSVKNSALPGNPGNDLPVEHYNPLSKVAAIRQERRSIDELNPAEYNPRKRLQPGDEEYERLKRSIETFGYVDPIIVNADGTVIGGHQRLFVLRDLGYSEADVAVVDLSKADEKALNIALNKISGEWDEEKLAALFADLNAEDYDLTLTGFSEDEYSEITAALTDSLQAELLGDPDEVPEPPKEPVTVLGDIWQIGRHRLMCGDSTNKSTVEMLMDGTNADVLLTSPPYGLGDGAAIRKKYKKGEKRLESLYNGHLDATEKWADLMQGFYDAAKPVTSAQFINVQMLAGNKIALIEFLNRNKDCFVDLMVWDKHTCPPQMQANVLNNAFEFVLIFDNDNNSRVIRYGDFHGTVSNFIETTKEQNQYADIHKAVFSIEFASKIININSKAKSFLDTFGGTGTTLVACEQLGRTCYTMELDPKYCDVIVNRYAAVTGKRDITLIRNGEEIPVDETGILN